MMRLRFIALACAALAYSSAEAHAQPGTEADSAVTPPKLVESSEPIYPETKRASGETASVALVLTLDAEGHVTNAEVSESAGAEFDQAALEAAKQLVFEPAQRGGTAVASKLPFRFDFKLAPAEPQSAPPPPLAKSPSAAPVAPAAGSEADQIEIEVEGERPPREPTSRSLVAAEITKIPGNNGDALRSLGSMPGVARPAGLDGLLIVRGSSPQDSQVFLDGSQIPLVYHFGGLSSVVPSEILERIDFYPGNFGPQFGRATGGVIDVGVRSPRKDKLGGLLQLDLIDARFLAEGPISKSTRFMIGGRRSWLDAWLGPALRESGVGVTTAPRYYDYQAMLEHDISRSTTARLFFFGADDRTVLTLNAPDPRDPSVGGAASSKETFWRVQGKLDSRLSDSARWQTTLAAGHNTQSNTVGDMFIDLGVYTFDARSDFRLEVSPALTAVAGVDMEYSGYDAAIRMPPVDFDTGDSSGPLFGRPATTLRAKKGIARPAGYAMLEVSPFPGLKLFPGIRADYHQDTGDVTFDPRLGARFDVHAGYPRTTLKGGVGIFHKPPEPYETIEPFGTKGVESERALHYSFGVEQELSRPVELSVEGFYKDLDNLVVSTPAVDSADSGVNYRNIGTGRTYGTELLLRYKPEGRFFGWVAYTLSRSERQDGPGEETYRFDYDQTHILTALGSVKLGRGWQLGSRFRYVTGSPYTPNLGGVMDYDAGVYSPVESRRNNSARLAAFHQLDVRVDKTWKFQRWALTWYLDVQNTYNHQNAEGVTYNYDYSKTTRTVGLPILPIVGLRGEL